MASSDDGTSAIHHRNPPKKREKNFLWMNESIRKSKENEMHLYLNTQKQRGSFQVPRSSRSSLYVYQMRWNKTQHKNIPWIDFEFAHHTRHNKKDSTLQVHLPLHIFRIHCMKHSKRKKIKSKVAAQKQLIFILIQPLCAYSTPQVTWSRTIHILTSGWSLAALSWNKQMLWIYCVLPLHSICILNSHKTC